MADLGRGFGAVTGPSSIFICWSPDAADCTPRQVFGDEQRLDPLDQRLEAAEMMAVELFGAVQRQGDAVSAHRVVTPQLEQPIQVYTIFEIHPLLADEFVRRGAMSGGLAWHFARPPVQGLDFEVDVRGVAHELVI